MSQAVPARRRATVEMRTAADGKRTLATRPGSASATLVTLADLAAAAQARDRADKQVSELVARLRDDDVSWTVIASQLSVTRQSAQRRYGRR